MGTKKLQNFGKQVHSISILLVTWKKHDFFHPVFFPSFPPQKKHTFSWGGLCPSAGRWRQPPFRGPGRVGAELRDAADDGAAAPGLCRDQQVLDGIEGWVWWMGFYRKVWGWGGWKIRDVLRWTNLYVALFRNSCDDGLPHQMRQLGQECFRAQAQLLRQKATRVPYRSSSLTQAGTAARFWKELLTC